jgi:hypothetical protein
MLVKNLITGTTPRVLHRNGNPSPWHERWHHIVEAFFSERQEAATPCANLTILTWSNRPTKCLLEQCLDRWQMPYVTLGRNLPEWRNDMKVYLNAAALREVSTEYVLALDGDDVLVISEPRQVLIDFWDFGCDLLFSTERNSCPDVPFLTDFEQSVSEPPYCFLNAGAWIGRTEMCRRFFRDCLDEDNGDILAVHPTKTIFRDDQGLTRKTFQRHHPAARLDDRCRIFQSLFDVPLDGEVLITGPGLAGEASSERHSSRTGVAS